MVFVEINPFLVLFRFKIRKRPNKFQTFDYFVIFHQYTKVLVLIVGAESTIRLSKPYN